MAGQARLTVDQIEHALKAASGNITYAADGLRVSRTTLYRRINESARLQQVLEDAREKLIDVAESALHKQVLEGNITAIIFTLKTVGKHRGYVERKEHEHSGKDGGAIEIKWANDLDDD